jgi:hypothetical protein
MITTTPLQQTTTPVWQAISLAPFVEILRVGECPDSGVVGRSYVSGYGDHVCFGKARVDMFVDHSVTIDGTCAVMGCRRSPVPNETRVHSLVSDESRVSLHHDLAPPSVLRMRPIPSVDVSCFDCLTHRRRKRRECVQSAIR